MRFEGLDVDVAGAIARGLREQRVDHADHGRIVLRFQQVRHLGHVLQQAVQINLVFRHAHHGRGIFGMAVRRRQQGFQRLVVHLRQRHVAMAAPNFPHCPFWRARADRQLHLARAQRQHGPLRARPGVGQGVRAHRSDSGSTATLCIKVLDTWIGMAAVRAGGLPGY